MMDDKEKNSQADLDKTQYMPREAVTGQSQSETEMDKTQYMRPSDLSTTTKDKSDRQSEEPTQYMGVVENSQAETETPSEKMSERQYQPGTKRPSLDDTQSLPRVDANQYEEPIQQPFPQKNNDGVRELPPDKELQLQGRPKGNWLQMHKKKAALLAGGFLVALFLGFMLAGYTQDKSEEAQNQRYLQEQAMQNKQDDLNRQEADLKQQQKELEQKKQDLLDRERELESKSSRAQGRNEALNDENQQGTLGKIIDKVTGKDEERKQSIQQNKETSAQADTDVADVKQSIDEAQQMLDDVNQKLDSVSSMKQDANNLADKAKSTYDENKGTIDTALDYAKAGAQLLVNWLTD